MSIRFKDGEIDERSITFREEIAWPLTLVVGFDAMGYGEHEDYSISQSSNPEFNKVNQSHC